MNFDRDRNRTLQNNSDSSIQILISTIQQLPIVKRVYFYILLMAVIGGAMGEVKYRLDSQNCMTNDSCWTVRPAQRRIRELGLGAIAGTVAATLIAIPALLEE